MKILKITSIKLLNRVFNTATRGRFKFKSGAIKFRNGLHTHIKNLRLSILTYSYFAKPYTKFIIKDSKSRLIHAPCFTDKLLQYAVYESIYDNLYNTFIQDTYSCIRGRGGSKALDTIRKYQHQSYKYYKYPMLIKLDISKFFYSINRSIVFDLFCKRFECEDTRILVAEKLKFSGYEKGLPLGNLTSQQFANMLLSKFDWYIKRILRIKYYVRYADDMFIIVDGKDEAKKVLTLSVNYLKEELDLTCNPKKCYTRPANEIIALGYKLIVNSKTGYNGIFVLSRTKNNLYKILTQNFILDNTIRGITHGGKIHRNKSFRRMTLDDRLIRLNSWYGHCKKANLKCYIWRTLARLNVKDIVFTGEKFVSVLPTYISRQHLSNYLINC